MVATKASKDVGWAGLYRVYRGYRLDIRRPDSTWCATAYGYYAPDGTYYAVPPHICVDEAAAVQYLVDRIDASHPAN